MSNSSSKAGRWIAAALATLLLVAVFYNLVKDNMPKGEVRQIEGYTPWPEETLKVAETLPVQNCLAGRLDYWLKRRYGDACVGMPASPSWRATAWASSVSPRAS